ncbi:MAG TPA: methyltransferase domain-containing protein, partial [Candidatus Deferrimicrobium sp.]|nr:methyltransferase domain-containing protein [Candidatus Deferrimicrobium sp.]
RIQFKIGDADQLPFPNNSIDFIVSTLSLHHWETPIQVFEEMMRVLKPDGTFLVFDFRRDARKFFYGLFTFATKVVVPKPLKKIHEPLGSIRASYTPNDIIQMLSQTAFQNVAIIPYLAWMFITNKKF